MMVEDGAILWNDGVCETIEQHFGRMFEKQWNDSSYALSTHFETLVVRIEALEKQVRTQNAIIKSMWAKVKVLESGK